MNTDEDFDQMVKDLQRRIDQEEELIYSKIVIREYKNPDKFGTLQNPDAVGEITGSCGDTMKISIKVSDDKITTARFWTDGCGATVASGNMLLKMAVGKTLDEAFNISIKELIKALDGLPKEHHHCAVLAVDTLRKTIKNYREKNLFKKKKT